MFWVARLLLSTGIVMSVMVWSLGSSCLSILGLLSCVVDMAVVLW